MLKSYDFDVNQIDLDLNFVPFLTPVITPEKLVHKGQMSIP
jgi:hypothetical protein